MSVLQTVCKVLVVERGKKWGETQSFSFSVLLKRKKETATLQRWLCVSCFLKRLSRKKHSSTSNQILLDLSEYETCDVIRLEHHRTEFIGQREGQRGRTRVQ